MGNRIDLDRFNQVKIEEKKVPFVNFKKIAELLVKKLAEKTDVNIRYGNITFTFHDGKCVHVDANPTFRIHDTHAKPPVIKMKLVRNK